MLLTSDEIEIIKSQGEWQDDYAIYKLPPFYLKQKKLIFPKLTQIQGNFSFNDEDQREKRTKTKRRESEGELNI